MSENFTVPSATVSLSVDDVSSRWVSIMQRVRIEYEEMPGLSVTVAQASRLWNIDASTAREVLNAMVDVGYLSAGPQGFTLRVFDRPVSNGGR